MSTKKRAADAPALGPLGMLRWAWTQLTKMNTALFLLLLLAVAAVPGSLFPQNIQDPSQVQDYIDQHPTWGPIADKLQLFDVFSSAWFSAIYLLLFISLVGCVIPRARKHAKEYRSKPPRTPRNLSRLPQHRVLSIPADSVPEGLTALRAVEDAERILKRRRYRTELRTENPKALSVGAERGLLREAGNLLFHLSMIGVLIGMAVGSLFGYSGQKIVLQGESFVNTLVSYDSFTPGTNFNPDRLRGFSVTLDSFDVQFDRQQDSPTYAQPLDFTAGVTVQEGPDEQPRQEEIKVNEPLTVAGNQIFLAGNGYAPLVKITDGNGDIAYEGAVVTLTSDQNYTSSVVLKVPDAAPDQLGFVGMFLPTGVIQDGQIPYSADPSLTHPSLVLASYAGDLGLDDGTPQNVYVLETEGLQELNSMQSQDGGIILTPEDPVYELPDGKGTIEFEGVSRYVGLDIHYDPGKSVVLISFLLAFSGLVISLFVARRRAWVKAWETEVDGTRMVQLEYGLLARGEDPRLAVEADRLTELFAQHWGLEFTEAQESPGAGA